jgi:hypothetical protein
VCKNNNIPVKQYFNQSKGEVPLSVIVWQWPKLPSSLRIFREMGVLTTKDDIQGKLKKREMTCMLVGYSVDHAKDVYRMLKLYTRRIISIRDLVWLRKTYKD